MPKMSMTEFVILMMIEHNLPQVAVPSFINIVIYKMLFYPLRCDYFVCLLFFFCPIAFLLLSQSRQDCNANFKSAQNAYIPPFPQRSIFENNVHI